MDELISKQMVINLWEQYRPYISIKTCEYDTALKKLLSVYSESCKGCKWEYAYGYGECYHCQRNFNDMYDGEVKGDE